MNLRFAVLSLATVYATAFASMNVAFAQDSALLDELVKKGVLSDQEAQDIQAKDEEQYSSTAASKIMLSSSIKTIQFYGDLRLRYELRDGTLGAGSQTGLGAAGATFSKNGDSQTMNRWRYRLRFGVEGLSPSPFLSV
jgi:hypothetical protein